MEISYLQAIKEGKRDIMKCKNCVYLNGFICVRFPPKRWQGMRVDRYCEEEVYVQPHSDDFCGEGLFVVPDSGRLDK